MYKTSSNTAHINIPFATQNNNGIANDCGQACAAMVISAYTGRELSARTVAIETGTASGTFTSIRGLIDIGAHYKQQWGSTRQATIDTVISKLDAGYPVICLVDYRQFSDNPTGYRYAHFLVATGYDDTDVYVNDPLREAPHRIPRHEFQKALDTPSIWVSGNQTGTNYPNQAIIPEVPLVTLKGLGFNIHADYLGNKPELIQRLKAAPPPALVVMDAPNTAREIRQAVPDTRVIYRKYIPDNSWVSMSPADYLAAYEAEGMTDFWLYIENEPDSHISKAPQLSAWLTEVAWLCVNRGYKAVLGNFGVGSPETTTWSAFNDLLAVVNKYPAQLAIGLHEYFPHLATFQWDINHKAYQYLKLSKDQIKSWYLGRFVFLIEHCASKGWNDVPIVITEFGTDIIHDTAALNWQRSLAGFDMDRNGYHTCKPQYDIWSDTVGTSAGEYYFSQLQWAWDNVYRPYPQVKGVCHFCYGGQGKWMWYDIADVPQIHTANATRGDFAVTTPATNTCDTYDVGRYKFDSTTDNYINIRSVPTISGNTPIARIYGQEILHVTSTEVVNADGYCWYPVAFKDKTGWCALSVGSWKFLPAVDICDYSDVIDALAGIRTQLNAALVHQDRVIEEANASKDDLLAAIAAVAAEINRLST